MTKIKISLSCSTKEFEEILKIKGLEVDELEINLRQRDPLVLQNEENRKKLIMDNFLHDSVRLEALYRQVRKKGYRMTRKTFSRDLDRLEADGLISSKKMHDDGTYKLIFKSKGGILNGI